jgi:hypothetical protein
MCIYEPVYLHPISAYEFQRQACPLALSFRDVSGRLLQHFEPSLEMLPYSVESLESGQNAIYIREY